MSLRRYLHLLPLYLAQALATGAATVSTILSSLIMSDMGRESLSGLPSTLINTSAALSAGLFGALMLRGRKLGLTLAFVLGMVGAVVGFLGGQYALMPLFLLGGMLMGAAQSGYQQARYAAAESVPPERRGLALGLLMLMSVLGSFGMTGASGLLHALGGRLGTGEEVTGWLVGGGMLLLAALLIVTWQPQAAVAQAKAKAETPPVAWREVFAPSVVRLNAMALATGQGVMATLMSLTPLRAHHMGLGHASIASLIAGHIAGMYGFGLLTGPLIDRLGPRFGYLSGGLLLMLAALTSMTTTHSGLMLSMFILGLGWNLVFVTGSKFMARYPAAQGPTDGLAYLAAGAGTLIGGLILKRLGFPVLAYICLAWSVLPLLTAWRVRRE